jgi:hypothetical protein
MVANEIAIPEVVWMRLGDEDSYHPFDTLKDAAQYLGDFYGIQQIDCKVQYGVTAPGFEGNNYSSLYWGTDPKDGGAEMTKALTEDEIEEFNLSLEISRALLNRLRQHGHSPSNPLASAVKAVG